MKLSFKKTWTVILTLMALTLSAIGVNPAQAATTRTVTDCAAPSGAAGRLVDQITAAASGDTINFSCSGTITLEAPIGIGQNLTIDGTGQTVTISGGGAMRVMFVNFGASLTLNNLTIANGKCTDCDGGGVYNAGTLIITNSTFSGNTADGAGGGVYLHTGMVTITNSTFYGNSSASVVGGGGIYQHTGTVTITNSTFSENSASGGNGGGVKNSGGGTMTLRNTILANNTLGGNCGGGVTDSGNNIDSGTTCGWDVASGSMSGTNPLLGVLSGSPAYFPLSTGSPAINAGNDAICAATPVNNTSQNGLTRPQGAHCDIGSFEKVYYTLFLPLILR